MAVAGSLVCTPTRLDDGRTIKYTVVWTSDAAGAVTENSFTVKTGELLQVTFTPDGGATQPTNLYDMTIADAGGVDVLAGGGANLSNATALAVVPVISTYFRLWLAGGALTPSISAAGNAKKGTITLLVR